MIKNRVGGCSGPWHIAGMSDYERIAKVIRYIEEHKERQPGLVELAGVVDLSAGHFHRLFSRWAGITPKDFLQSLTLAHAKALLIKGDSVLDSALGAGLSGPGRLHDLCVVLEAASPGELKSGGAGWKIMAGFAESPFGRCLVAEGARGICHFSFIEEGGDGAAWDRLRAAWFNAELVRDDGRADELCRIIFIRRRKPLAQSPLQAPLRLFVMGTEFQVKVWRALLEIPEGKLMSYGRLADCVGHPGASRAVGSAVGKNPIGYLIPCHRVIRESGAIGGYAWGTDRKRAVQAWERCLSSD